MWLGEGGREPGKVAEAHGRIEQHLKGTLAQFEACVADIKHWMLGNSTIRSGADETANNGSVEDILIAA